MTDEYLARDAGFDAYFEDFDGIGEAMHWLNVNGYGARMAFARGWTEAQDYSSAIYQKQRAQS